MRCTSRSAGGAQQLGKDRLTSNSFGKGWMVTKELHLSLETPVLGEQTVNLLIRVAMVNQWATHAAKKRSFDA
jgi:hypothetical protein